MLDKKRKGNPHEYFLEIERKRKQNLKKNRHLFETDSSTNFSEHLQNANNNEILFNNLSSKYDFLTKKKSKSKFADFDLEPVYFSGLNKTSIEYKIRLAFTGFVISKIKETTITHGKLILFNGDIKKIRLSNLYQKIKEALLKFRNWKEKTIEPPLLILNQHCQLCEYKDSCLQKAKESSSLSLLSRINNEKIIQKYQKKGIFNLLQLSFLYRPRRRKKKSKTNIIKHSFELQALAIKENKVYIKQEPKIIRKGVELFLDVETIPDEGFCYLIGIGIKDELEYVYHDFWAESLEEEKQNLVSATKLIRNCPDIPIYHYGNYDERVFKSLGKKYDINIEDVLLRFKNLNSYIFGKIYFPVYSNSIKEISKYLGLNTENEISSGLESIVIRYKWERTKDECIKARLIKYNSNDCKALLYLVNKLSDISKDINTTSTVNLISQPRKNSTSDGLFMHTQFESIIKMGHENYDEKKIKLNGNTDSKGVIKNSGRVKRLRKFKKTRKVRKEIYLAKSDECPIHKVKLVYKGNNKHKIITDLIFTKNGIRKTNIKYIYESGICLECNKTIFPSKILAIKNKYFGRNFKVWIAFQRVYLRLPHEVIKNIIEIQFNETIGSGSVTNFMHSIAKYYLKSEKLLEQKIKNSSFVHIDETKLSIRGVDYYVWTFTDSIHVVFELTLTRETNIIHEFLEGYKGVLITDFYPGYDSINCKQQKCWAHLIRDINDDLWKHPFDSEYEKFVSNFRDLIIPIFESIQKFGLKKYHFNKFIKKVKQYYQKHIIEQSYYSELCQKYQKRLNKYEYALFTFLNEDGIPWNNNTAERALRHLAVQRKISGHFSKNGAEDYLRLLGIMQTCRFQRKCFLRFMLTGLFDIDKFKK